MLKMKVDSAKMGIGNTVLPKKAWGMRALDQ